MLRSLLVGLDGTPACEGVLDLAIDWARRGDLLLVGLGVVDEPGIHGPEEMLIGEVYFQAVNETMLQDTRHHVDAILHHAALRCVQAGVAFKPLEDEGIPHVQILREAQRFDLIMLSRETHFRFGWESARDDTLTRVLADCPRPVVVVPAVRPEHDAVLIAYDGSHASSRVLAQFEASGLGKGREITVLSVAEDLALAARTADRAVEYLRSHDLASTPLCLSHADSPADAILNMARELAVGLVVMGAHGRPSLRAFLMGSITRRLIETSRVPLFLYH